MRKYLALMAALLWTTSLFAGDAAETVRMVSDSLIQHLIAEHREIKSDPTRVEVLVKSLVLPTFDSEALSRRVLAKNWKTISAAQQTRFTEEFSAYLVRFYSRAFANYNGETVDYDDKIETDERGVATVKTRIMRKAGQPIPVAYRMSQETGQWKIVDVIVEGISLVQSKRDEFAGVISGKGIDQLIADLAAKNHQNPMETR